MLPIQITIRDFPNTDALESIIRKKVAKLTQFYDRINSCRIVVELQQKHKHQGKLYSVRIDVMVPGKELVVTHKKHEDVYIAVRDSFNAISRQLEDHGRKRNGKTKAHIQVLHGYIIRIFTKEGYGFIEGTDGNEYYFSITNVSYPQFKQLAIGDAVEYIPEMYNDGWHALHVVREKNHHTHAA